MPSRRHVLRIGGGLLAGFATLRLPLAAEPAEIRMRGNADGSDVWFDPVGIRIEPGQTVRWINLDPGNSHTATAYHPANVERPLRIPQGAEPWSSDYLLPNETCSVTLTVEGVYDYFCIPHEHAGMVGRIVVARSGDKPATLQDDDGTQRIPEIARRALPRVDDILIRGIVRRM
jgi:plastocyanin